jgi:hypothetical protein
MVFTFLATTHLMQKLVTSLIKTPIITFTDDVPVHITEIYFPAVTFCPGIILASTARKVFDYDQIVNSLENGEMDFDNLTDSE